MLRATLCVLTLTLVTASDQRWSRQINSYTSDMSDWVPLPGPVERPERREFQAQSHVKRQVAQPRILAEPFPGFTRPTGFSQDFPSRAFYQGPANRQLYLQSLPAVPSAPQNYLTDQGFGQPIRFGLSQQNSPLNQGFVAPPLSPPLSFESFPQMLPQNPRASSQVRFNSFPKVPEQRPQSQIKFDSFPKTNPPLSPQAKPFNPQLPKVPPTKPTAPKFVDGYRLENSSFAFQKKKPNPQSLQKIKFENFEKPKVDSMINKPKSEREEVQLLYVPVESLNRGNFNFRAQNNQALVGTDLYQALPKPNPVPQTFGPDFQRPLQKPLENFKFEQDYYSGLNSPLSEFDQVPKFSTITSPFPTLPPTTPRPKKLKPHQPPLAVFLAQEAKKGEKVKVADVLSTLKNAKSVSVLDSVSPNNAPKVFIGPLTLTAPDNYVKFELPYLSNIDGTDRKLRQLPFFVAPLSYHTPEGFAKIPFPSPHVGSVIVNSLIKDTTTKTPAADVIPNSYTASTPTFKPESQKPTFSYYSTAAPKTNPPQTTYKQSNYYSFEPQMVTSLRTKEPEPAIVTAPPNTNSYFLSNSGQYNPQTNSGKYNHQTNSGQYNHQTNSGQYNPQTNSGQYNPQIQFISNQKNVSPQTHGKQTEQTTTPKVSTPPAKTSTQQSSTYPSQLLETHNPYSINQAFHLSTPLDYNNYFDDLKEGYVTPGSESAETPTPKTKEPVTEKPFQQSSPNYLQNYNPEIHYESENNGRYPVYSEDYSKNQQTSTGNEYGGIVETQSPVLSQSQDSGLNEGSQEVHSTRDPEYYNQYSSVDYKEPVQETTTTSTTSTTTTTKRPIVRARNRPRYTTQKPDSGETTSRTVTRRPLRERKPLPTRARYEPNKITTEKPARRPVESAEVTTKSSSTRTRGRVSFKPTEGDDGSYSDRKQNKKADEDLAYQRDVLHQNYPVTLMERMSTVDIEAMTESAPRISSTRNLEPNTESYDTAPAFSNEQLYSSNSESKEPETVAFTSRYTESQTETSYVPRLPTTREEVYYSRSSAPAESYPTNPVSKEESYAKSTTPIRAPEVVSISTEPTSPVTEQAQTRYSISNEYSSPIEEEVTTPKSYEITKEKESEEEVETTPASIYNRVRVRPGGIRQYQQTTTEAPATSKSTKVDIRKRPQAVTYRPALDKRRTTMRIDEIEADLKTKQVRTRPDVQDRHPVYRPEPTTESVYTTASPDATSKRGQFRRRRPSYSTTSTEASVSKKTNYDVKNRFRGRRPTDKPKEVEAQTEATAPQTSTSRTIPYNRYTRPRLAERFNKKPTEPTEETEDQDTNYSINIPKFVIPEEKADGEQWSPKFSADSFKPYNPNDIPDDKKIATTERRSIESDDEDIITARNDYDDILVSVTPASNRLNKKVPDIPPTLEALVEQSKVTNTESASTFESMLEEVMKSLEEQDENEYSSNVMKHKGGEIGEIPPEKVISNEEVKSTTIVEERVTTEAAVSETSPVSEEPKEKRRRGFWKKVQRRPVTTESIEVAESQYYTNTVNQLGEPVKPSRQSHDKYADKSYEKAKVTTYKPNFQLKDLFETEEEADADIDPYLNQDIPKLSAKVAEKTTQQPERKTTKDIADYDFGTGSPDATMPDMFYNPTTTEPSREVGPSMLDRSDGFSFMDYLFGITSNDEKEGEIDVKTESVKPTLQTTESSFVPDEITTPSNEDIATLDFDVKKANTTEEFKTEKVDISTEKSESNVESSSVSSFMDPSNVMSTSMSYEVSHETEICFRGKCIKTSKDLL